MGDTPGGRRPGGDPGVRNLLLVRTGITFALLASVVSVHFREPGLLLDEGFRFLYVAVVVSYGWLLLRYAGWGTGELPGPVAVLQAIVDVAFVSIIVLATGMVDSVFTFMYIVVILLGSIEQFMRGALTWALVSAIAYTAMAWLQMKGVLLPPGLEDVRLDTGHFLRAVTTNSIGFLLTGVLSGLLGQDIRVSRLRVRDREEDLRELERFNKYVVDNIPSGIITADVQGRAGLINGAACAILGVKADEVQGKPVEDLFGGLSPGFLREDHRSPRPEFTFRRADGTEIFLGFSLSPLRNSAGEVIGRVVIFQDLTPIKRMEERIRIADRLAGVGELAAGLAHEIRNPLASIAGASQMLAESGDIADEGRQLLDIIGRESTRLNGLISGFLAFTGPSPRNVGPVDLAPLVDRVAEALRAGEAREKGVEVERKGLASVCTEGDGEQLSQVIWNLARNAVQATPSGGRVCFDLSVRERHPERFAVMSVSDTGKGIDPAVAERICKPFFTTKEGGTGLGLAISQRIVALHRGFLEVRSVPGEGSTFSVFLPDKDAVPASGVQ